MIHTDVEEKKLNHQPTTNSPTVRDCVGNALQNYFRLLDGQPVNHIYDMVISEVEAALFETVIQYAGGNQTNAAALLGISRGTLRKKLLQYGLS